MQNTCRLCRLGADLVHTFLKKVCVSQTMQTFEKSASLHADFMHTFSMRCKVCIKSPTRASKPNRNLGILHDASAQSAYQCVQISIPEFSRGKSKTFQGWKPHRFVAPIRQFSIRSDLWYVPILGTFLSYERSLLRSFGGPGAPV